MYLNKIKSLSMQSSLRQVLILLAVFSFISTAAWGVTYWMVEKEMKAGVTERLNARMKEAVVALESGGSLPALKSGETAEFSTDPQVEGFFTVDPNTPDEPQFRFLVKTLPNGSVVLGENTERQEEALDYLSAGMQTTLLVTLLVVIPIGLWLAGRSQARVKSINEGLVKVAQGHLHTRIDIEGSRDDLSLVADRINLTTERLGVVMSQMRVQSSNIAHELRTPLARLRAQLETHLQAKKGSEQAVSEQELEVAIEQIDEISATFDALLRLSRIESGVGRDRFMSIDLGDVAKSTLETFGPVVEEANQSLILELVEPEKVVGDRDMLVQLLANLVQNAMRYGASEQTITIKIHGTRVFVNDEGEGIPVSERENVLEPFYQADKSRSGDGFGLGLAMVRAICELHDAKLSLSDGLNGKGLKVSVSFSPESST